MISFLSIRLVLQGSFADSDEEVDLVRPMRIVSLNVFPVFFTRGYISIGWRGRRLPEKKNEYSNCCKSCLIAAVEKMNYEYKGSSCDSPNPGAIRCVIALSEVSIAELVLSGVDVL